MILIMLGAPGAGKGTVGKALAKKINAKYIATGDVFRHIISTDDNELGKEIKKYMEKGELVPDELAIKIFTDEILPKDLNCNMILDGYPRTETQAKNFDEFLSNKNLKINSAINIDVSNELIIDRIINRRICPKCNAIYNLKYGKKPVHDGICNDCGVALIQRADDKENVIRERLNTYEINTKPLINYYENQGKLRNICAKEDTSIEELVNESLNYVQIGE